jgi:hypothetical protein
VPSSAAGGTPPRGFGTGAALLLAAAMMPLAERMLEHTDTTRADNLNLAVTARLR